MIQDDYTSQTRVSEDLSAAQAQIAELNERKIAAESELANTIIKALQTGKVHELTVRAAGGMLDAGEARIRIVPTADDLRVDVRVSPQDIDQVPVGQKVIMHFSAMNLRRPELNGAVEQLPQTSRLTLELAPYYAVRIGLTSAELNRLGNVRLVVGMPVEAFIKPQRRTALNYLIKRLSTRFHARSAAIEVSVAVRAGRLVTPSTFNVRAGKDRFVQIGYRVRSALLHLGNQRISGNTHRRFPL